MCHVIYFDFDEYTFYFLSILFDSALFVVYTEIVGQEKLVFVFFAIFAKKQKE